MTHVKRRTGRLLLLLAWLLLAGAGFGPAPVRAEVFRLKVSHEGASREIDLEEYVGGVVLAEVGPAWPAEALKAMAVCARTFALARAVDNGDRPYHLTTTTSDQVYRDGFRVHDSIVAAVEATRGEVITYCGDLARVFYHADSGGFTAASSSVWGSDFPYLRGVADPYSTRADRYCGWKLELGAREFIEKLGMNGTLKGISVQGRTACKRVVTLGITLDNGRTMEMSGRYLRERILGGEKLRSVMFDVDLVRGRVVFTGSGYGHGVGLSQWGARRMAEEGFGYRDILLFYFPGTALMGARFD